MLLVSIHDVTPAHELNVRRLWQLCVARGVRPALLVVPNWHGRWPLEAHPQFLEWVRARAAEGVELALHGDRHDEEELPRTSKDRWRAWGRTDAEGEFLTLDATAARARVVRGLACLRGLGLEPTGFVPPAWLARESTYRAAASVGLSFSEDQRWVHLLQTGRRVRSPVVRWSARTSTRAWGSVVVAVGRWALQGRSQWPRIALHPGDLDHPATARSLGHTLDRWLGRHQPGRYDDLAAQLEPA